MAENVRAPELRNDATTGRRPAKPVNSPWGDVAERQGGEKRSYYDKLSNLLEDLRKLGRFAQLLPSAEVIILNC